MTESAMCPTEEMATTALRSVCRIALRLLYTSEMAHRVRTTGRSAAHAAGNQLRKARAIPHADSFRTSPAKSTLPPTGAWACARNSQVWKGSNGVFTAKARANPEARARLAPAESSDVRVPVSRGPGSPHQRRTREASMARLPSRV